MVESDVESKALMKLFLEIPPDAAKITGEPDIKFLKMLAGKLEEVRATRVGAFDRSDNAVLIFEIQELVIELLLRCKQNDASAIATTTHLKKKSEFLTRFAVNIFKLTNGEMLCHESDISMPLLQELHRCGIKCRFKKGGAEIVPINLEELNACKKYCGIRN